MQLDVLTRGDIGKVPRILPGELPDNPQLRGGQNAIRQADAHHEIFGSLAFATHAPCSAHAIALRIDAPPLEIRTGPLRQHTISALPGELANLVPGLPRILGGLQPFGLLGLRLFHYGCDGSAHAGFLNHLG